MQGSAKLPVNGGSRNGRNRGRCRYPQRTLHLIDIENLAASPLPSLGRVSRIRELYTDRHALGDKDLVVVASNHFALPNAAFGWPGADRRTRSGRNGADQALLDVVQQENVAERFTHVSIGSGDHAFAAAARLLRDQGVEVTVVSWAASLSPLLAEAADHVILLDATAEAA